jgi:xanthine dehydrogenase accessory factor
LVIGVGHVGKAVVHLARWLGMRVIASDDRAEFCNPEATPGADEYVVAPISELPQHITFTSQTYVLLTTRNISVDMAGLPELLEAPSAYVGVIGSRRRWATTRQKLLEAGVSESDADRVISPMGLELGAETPDEIAISMLSEIIMLRRGGDGRRMNGS